MSTNNGESNVIFEMLACTKLPIVTGKVVDAVVFGSDASDPEVIALVHKKPGADTDKALVRLHSACITSEVLGSSKCDCAEQLDTAISLVSEADWGIVVYLLKHEGRGIGLVNKIRAYSLQDKGLDTVDANLELGFGADDRDFDPAVKALELMGVKRIELLTNNPDKVAALRTSGFDVVKRIAMDVPITDFNRGYLIKKQQYFGHQPARCPSTEFLTVEAVADIFESEISNAARGVSALVVHIEKANADTSNAQNDVVVQVAEVIKGHALFEASLIARMSDDRFLILLRDTDVELAERMAEKLHDAIRSVNTPHKKNGDGLKPIASSIGIADSCTGGSMSELTSAATAAVERALGNGGQQIAVGSEASMCTA
ncbi:hypothetical protein A9Q99_25370 [Gammaproteobacteria bacterium 45_16_T64]|nr:hypothetical protein A9Q99_25370 [Gammaproteobacteria bacterium 45_16_T64]